MTTSETREPRGSIEIFLQVNSLDIPAEARAKMREAACKAVQGATLDVHHCPPHLQDAFRRIVTEAAYVAKCGRQPFNAKMKVMPEAGIPYRNQSRKCRL